MMRRYNLNVIVFQETKKESLPIKLIRVGVGKELSDWCAIPFVVLVGGLLVAWNLVEVQKVDFFVGNFFVSIHLMVWIVLRASN